MPLLWLSLSFLTGLMLGRDGTLPGWGWVLLALPFAALAFLDRRLRARYPFWQQLAAFLHLSPFLLAAALLLGLARQASAIQDITPAALEWYAGQGEITLRGVVSQPPEAAEKTQQVVLEVYELTPAADNPAWTPVSGKLLAVIPTATTYRYGDRLELSGALFDLEEHTEIIGRNSALQQGITSAMSYPKLRLMQREAGDPFLAFLYELRFDARATLRQLLPQPESGLLTGILLGIDSDLPRSVRSAFQATGTAHIWAISGFNIAVLSGLLVTMLGRLLPTRPFLAALAAVAVTGVYTLLVGASPSVVRAAIMGAAGTFGLLLGRRQVGVNSLAFTAALMCLFEPSLPWSLSFQLSFLATLGLVVFGEPLQTRLHGLLERRLGPVWARRIAGPVGEYLLLTLAAQAATLPVTAITFQRISLSAALANPLVLPVQPLIMALGGLALLLGMAFLALGQLAAALAWPPLAYTVRVVESLAAVPGGVLSTQISAPLMVAYVVLLAALAVGLYWPQFFTRRLRPALLVGGAALLALGVWRAAASAPDGRLHMAVFQCGGPPGVLVQTPGGDFLMINGGSDANCLAAELGRRLPPLAPTLKAWLVTAHSTSALEGIDDLGSRFPPGQALFSARLPTSATRTRVFTALKQRSIPVSTLDEGASLELGNGARLSVPAVTREGTALLVEWGSFRALVPSGVPLKTLQKTGSDGLSLLVLGPADLETQTPSAWAALGAGMAVWWRTGPQIDLPGWVDLGKAGRVEITTDGTQMWAEAGR